MELKLGWPDGAFALVGTELQFDTGSHDVQCPEGTGFEWQTGEVFVGGNEPIVKVHIKDEIYKPAASSARGGFWQHYCSKTKNSASNFFTLKWPKGSYCFASKSPNPASPENCPSGWFGRFVVFGVKQLKR